MLVKEEYNYFALARFINNLLINVTETASHKSEINKAVLLELLLDCVIACLILILLINRLLITSAKQSWVNVNVNQLINDNKGFVLSVMTTWILLQCVSYNTVNKELKLPS